jgi:hypothetical protein
MLNKIAVVVMTGSISRLLLHADFLLGLIFNPENGGDIFLRNFS